MQSLTTDSGLLTSYSYESNRNLRTQIKNEFNTQLISQYNYVYNELGLRDSVDTIGPAFSGVTVIPMGQTTTYTPNPLNQYTQITTDNGPLTTDSLIYDDDGNLTSVISVISVREYTYNAENRLIAVQPQTPVDGDTKVEFMYDYMGRRIKKSVFAFSSDSWLLTSDFLFLFDGWNLIEEQVSSIPNPVSRFYIWGLDLSQSLQGTGGVGGLIASIDTSMSKMYNYMYDANGNVGQLVDTSDGSIAAHYEYDPFGKMLHASGSLANENPFRFSTKYYDSETELYYYGYRYYSPNLGRWITRDPIEEEGGFNLYAFVGNSPIRYIDSLGLECITSSCNSLSIHFSLSLYEIVGATIDVAAEGKVCDCCCDGDIKEKAYLQGKVSAGGDVGIGLGMETRIFGSRAGLLFKGPNIPIAVQANITRECDGSICGGLGHEWSGRLQGSISGGVGPVGGAVAAYYYVILSYGIMVDSNAISFYLKVDGGRDVQTELNLWIVQWQHTFAGGISRNWVDIKVPIYEF